MNKLVASALMAVVASASVFAVEKGEAGEVLSHKMTSLEGKEVDLSKYQGQVVLIVNVASKCGYTPQYTGLQALHSEYGEQGLAVLGFPCNQFLGQEPGTSEDIAAFCEKEYGVEFDMFEKIEVKGKGASELYKQLTSKEVLGDDAGPVKWNFEKFLVGRDGKVIKRYRSGATPESLAGAIEAELAKKGS
jgi:glutathione peroxidase